MILYLINYICLYIYLFYIYMTNLKNIIINSSGLLASIFACIFLIPQVYKIYQTNDTSSFSLTSIVIISLSQILWIIYAWLTMNQVKTNIYVLIKSLIKLLFLSYILYSIINNNKENKEPDYMY